MSTEPLTLLPILRTPPYTSVSIRFDLRFFRLPAGRKTEKRAPMSFLHFCTALWMRATIVALYCPRQGGARERADALDRAATPRRASIRTAAQSKRGQRFLAGSSS